MESRTVHWWITLKVCTLSASDQNASKTKKRFVQSVTQVI